MVLRRQLGKFLLAALLGVATVGYAADKAPAGLSGVLIEGAPFDLAQHRGKVVMVNFWATWCPACRADFPVWQQVYERFGGNDFEMVAVSIDRDHGAVKRFLNNHPYTVPVVWRFDSSQKDTFPRIRKTPTTYFIGRDGNVAGVRLGRVTEEQLIQTIEALLQP